MHILSPIPLKHWAQASIEIVEGDFRGQERNVQSHLCSLEKWRGEGSDFGDFE